MQRLGQYIRRSHPKLMRFYELLGFLVVILLSGCKVGPDYQRPTIATPSQWRTGSPTAESMANLPWWEVFKDPVLTNLISTALHNNQDLRIAAARVEQALGNYRIQKASLLPWINGSADWTRGRSGITGQTSGQFDIFGSLSYEIDFWGRLRRLTESARAQLLASEEGRKNVYIALVAQVATTYFDLRSLDEQLVIARQTFITRTNSLQLTRVKYDNNNGIVSELDVRQAESQVYAAQSSIVDLEKAVAITENALSFLLGGNPGAITRGRSIAAQHQPGAIPAGLPSDLLLRRPDILAAEQRLIAANANIGAARAAYFPTISITAALGLQSIQLQDLFSAGTSKAWNFAPQIAGPIFNGGRIRAGVQVAEAQQRELLAAYEQTIQDAFREVDDALITVAKLREQIAIGEAAVLSERRRLELSFDRYDNGVSGFLDVLDAERALFSAQLGLAQARGDLLSAISLAYKALGGGWTPARDPSNSRQTSVPQDRQQTR
jgi:multidrug efflux system outer membrane protein